MKLRHCAEMLAQRCRRTWRPATQIGLFFLTAWFALGDVALGEDGKYAIARIEARLFSQGTGELANSDLLDGKDHALWNTIIGEGEATGKPSSVTWVLIELSGPSFAGTPGRLIVSARANKTTLLSQTLTLGTYFNEGNRLLLPFLVYGTGCAPLEITASLAGIPATKLRGASMTRRVPFKCGE